MDDYDPASKRRSVHEIRLEALEARKRSIAIRKAVERRRRLERLIRILVFVGILAVAAILYVLFPR